MARGYRHISQYEKEIFQLREKGFSLKGIGEQLGFTKTQVHNFISRYNRKQKEIAKGKSTSKQNKGKNKRLKDIIASKDARIKTLEMDNELMRDFLLLAERM